MPTIAADARSPRETTAGQPGKSDALLANYWYPVWLERDLGDVPVRVELLEEQLVLFRTSAGVHAFKDLCVHRGSALSLGRVENDCLICPYHGWTYTGDGRCVRIPAHDRTMRAIPARARAETYHCRVRHGLVWVCVGTPRQDVYDHPSLEMPGWRTSLCGPYRMDAVVTRALENALDIAHLAWVHDGIIGDSQYPDINDYQVTRTEHGLTTTRIEVVAPNAYGTGEARRSFLEYDIFSPLAVRIHKWSPDSDEEVHLAIWAAPERANRTVLFMLRSRNFALTEPDEKFTIFQDTIVAQDISIVESQRPELLPLDLAAEMHVKSDRVTIEWRRWLRELGVTLGTQ